MTQPPRFNKDAKLDFSQFHPLTHPPFTKKCRGYYGGSRNHIELWWDFKGRPALRAATLCKIGRHRKVKAWRRDSPQSTEWRTEWVCHHCPKKFKDDEGETQ